MTLLKTLIFTQIGSVYRGTRCAFSLRDYLYNIFARQNIRLSTKASDGPVITFLVALALLFASTSIYLKLVLSHVTNCLSLPFLSLYIYFFSTSLMMCGNNIIIKSFHEMKGDVGMAS